MQEVKLIKRTDIDIAIDSIALAYEGYPLFNYVVGDDSKSKPIKQIIMSSVKASKLDFIGISAGKRAEAVAIFIKPNYNGSPALPFLFSGGIKLIFRYSLRIIFRLLKYEKYAMQMKQKYSDDMCWYLYILAVHPEYQHKGLASMVMQPMLNFFDATGQSCYLETHKFCNIEMYEHFGFRLMEIGKIPKTNVGHYAMRREPNESTVQR